MEQPKRSNDKYWKGTRDFDHIQFEMDLEEHIRELEERMEAKVISSNPLVIKSGCGCTSPISGTSIYKCGRCGREI